MGYKHMRELVCFAGGVLFGTAVNKVQENAEDVLAEAKAVNEARAQQAQDAQEEEEVPAE